MMKKTNQPIINKQQDIYALALYMMDLNNGTHSSADTSFILWKGHFGILWWIQR